MAQKLDRSYFGTGNRKVTTGTNKRDTSGAAKAVQKLDRSHFNKPKSALISGASPTKTTQKKSFFEIATQNKAPGRVAENAKPRQTSYAGQLGQVSRNAAAPNSRYDAENLRTAQKQEVAAPSIGKDRSNQYSLRKGLESVVLKGGQQVAQAAGNTAALAEDLVLAPFEFFSGQELGSLSDNAPFNTWARGIQRNGQALQDKYAENVAKGGKAAELLDRYGASTVAAVPQAVLAMLTSGGSMAASTAGVSSAAAAELAPGVASTIRRSIAAAAKDPQYWLSFGQVVGDGYESALQDMQASGKYDNNTARTKAALYAIGNGILNAEVEVGGGIQKLPEELKHGAAAWKAWVDSMVDEGKEEVVQGIIERAMQNSVYDKGNPLTSLSNPDAILNPYTSAEEFAGGAIVGGILGAGQIGAQKVLESQYNQMAAQQAAQQGAQERTDVQDGTRTAPAQTNAQTQQEAAQRAIQEAVQRQTASNPASAEEQVLRQREAAVRKAADVLGQNGAKALTGYYSQTAGANPETTVRDFYRAYNAALNGTTAQDTNIPTALRMAAENAGQRDARVASQAKYFGENAQLVRDTSWKKANLPSKTSYALDSLAKTLGVEIRFADTVDEGRANAQYKDGVITLALDADDPVMTSVIHEATHRIKAISPESYEKLASFVQSNLSKEGTDFNMGVREQLYQTSDTNVLTEEMVADAFGRMVGDESTLAEFTMQNRSTVQKIVDTLTDIINAVKRALKGQNVQLSGRQRAAFRDLQGRVTEMRNLFNAALREAEQNKNTATEGGETRFSLKTVNGENIVWIDNNPLTSKELRDHKAIANYIAEHIGEMYTIIESGQRVYLGTELPGEYTQSKYTSYLNKRDKQTLRAKNKAASGLGEMIEIATNRRWEATRHKQNKDAKYGIYRYDSSFAFPITQKDGSISNVRAYDVELLIRNASDGKKYLYDIVNVKENTTDAIDLLKRENQKRSRKAPSHGDASTNRVASEDQNVNGNFSPTENGGDTKEKIRYSLKDYSDVEKRDHRKKAIAFFGKTYNWNETGYLTPAGTKLDFSGRHEGGPGGYRTVDHRDIRDAISEDYGGDDYSGSMVQFMSEGNIRISPESGGINLSVEPTNSQMDALADFIGKNRGEVILDLDTPDGQTISSTEYPRGTHSSKVLTDIKAYFKDGTVPYVSELAQFRDSKKTKQFLEDYAREHGEMPTDTTPSAMKAFYERVYGREGWNGLGNADAGTVNSAFEAMQANMEEGDAYDINRQAAERLPGEQGRAPSEVPKVNPETGKNVTKTVSTILNSPLTSNDMARVYENAIADGTFDYEQIGDKTAIEQAQQRVNRDGWETVAQRVLAKSSKTGFGQAFTKHDMADAISAYNAAVTAGDNKMAYDLVLAISGAAHDSAQVMQAMNLMNRLTPEGKLLTLRRYVDQLNDKQAKKNSKMENSTKKSQRAATQEQIDNSRLNYVEKATGFRISEELATNYLMAEGDAERAAAWDAITTDIANQLPSTFREKANFWRYTMMLTNPTTHIRNMLGNAIQYGVRKLKNGVGTAIERAVIRDQSQRTKTISLGEDGKALRAFATEQYQADEKAAMGAGKYSDSGLGAIEREIQSKRKMFRGDNPASKAIQKIGDVNNALLDVEDQRFNRWAYVDSFTQALKAKGVTAAEAVSGQKHDLVEAARQYAISEAQKATYRNSTALSEALSKLGRSDDNPVIKARSIAVDAILPFRRTPANILTTGLEYSPVGFLKSITYDLYQVRKGEISAADMVDHLSAGLTGSGIFALGAFLAAEGLLHAKAGDDDKEEKFNKATGIQEYSLEIGGKTYTLDWALPAAMPLFAGAAVMESIQNGGGTFSAVVDALFGTSDVVLETSMLSSLNDFLSNISYADNIPTYIIDRVLSSYGGQYVPTLGSKVASFADDTVRKSYVGKGTGQVASDADYFRQSVMKKVPGLRNKLQPSIDLWGNEISNGSVWERGIQSFISPGYLKTIDNDPVNQEIRRLAKATGEDSVYPTEAEKRLTTDDGDKNLTAEEYMEYAKLLGQIRYQALKGLLESSSYKNLSDGDKVSAIENVYKYAKKSAKAEILGQDGIGWEAKAQEAQKKYGIKPEVYAALYTQVSGIESVKDRNGETIPNSKGLLIMQAIYNTSGLSEAQRNALFEYLGVGKSIRHYNKALVNEKVRKNARLAGK